MQNKGLKVTLESADTKNTRGGCPRPRIHPRKQMYGSFTFTPSPPILCPVRTSHQPARRIVGGSRVSSHMPPMPLPTTPPAPGGSPRVQYRRGIGVLSPDGSEWLLRDTNSLRARLS